jgi:cytochrome c553
VFPEIEGWSDSYYANPYPLSEEFYLVTWSPERLWKHAFNPDGTPVPGPVNSLGVYLFDAFGNLELLYRDAAISSACPLPVRPRPRPAALAAEATWEAEPAVGELLLQDVYRGDLSGFARGTVRRLRIVGIPPKTQPNMNSPMLGVTQDDPGKFVLGTVPVEADGSAYFRVPAGMPLFVQALDGEGVALQTMRSATYVPPGQTYACVGCHDHRQTAPPSQPPLAASRLPSAIEPGPEGSWPLEFAALVQPVLERQCVRCHRPGAEGDGAKSDLTAASAYQTLVDYGGPQSLRQHVLDRWNERRSKAGAGAASTSPLLRLLRGGHYEVALSAGDWERLVTWLDTYGQLRGSYSPEQEDRLRRLREEMKSLLAADETTTDAGR